MRQTIAALVILACTASLRATTFIATDLNELTRDAQTIARGRVVAVESRWSDDHQRIETLVTLAAENYLKGALGDTVEFVVPGGRLGRYRSIVIGAPQFRTGDRLIVFLGARAPSLPHVIGLNQGLFRLVQESDGWKVTPPPIVQSSTAATPVVRGDPARRTMALDAFERQVIALMRSAR